jgi:hypothetical protein
MQICCVTFKPKYELDLYVMSRYCLLMYKSKEKNRQIEWVIIANRSDIEDKLQRKWK